MRIGVLHYHFLRSGVRTVIANALRALIAHGGYETLEIDLISSDARHTAGNSLAEELLEYARHNGSSRLRLSQIEIAELAYNDQPASDRDALFDRANRLSEQLLRSMELERSDLDNPYILHVHNGNLGKNPYLTLALKLLIERIERDNLPAWVLYQVHDFAEDNRPLCWQALCDCSGRSDPRLAVEMMYPTGRRVQWACINSADKKILVEMGIDSDSVSILPNAVAVDVFTAGGLTDMSGGEVRQLGITPIDFTADIKSRLSFYAEENGFRFESDRKILLAPVKAIRRKNIVESVLLMLMLNYKRDEYQLLVTLPANSSADIAYSCAIERFVKENHLPVVIGFGSQLLAGGHQRHIEKAKVISYSLIDLLALSEAVVTTSIQEGFGYVFHEPWLADRFVFGRNIDRVTSDFTEQGLNLDHLYDHLLIPFEWLAGEQWERIQQEYLCKVKKQYQAMQLSEPSDAEILEQITEKKLHTPSIFPSNKSKKMGEMIDWADLNVNTQLSILHHIVGDLSQIPRIIVKKKWGKPISDWYFEAKSGIILQNRAVIGTKYNLENQASCLVRVLEKGKNLPELTESAVGGLRSISNKPIFARSLELGNMRLLA
ncbi:MAG: hypothetical protein KAT56_05400 [Sedimentisphaerales bacterium]|nr:hypothetical protein [Sedimentisphaerales bacterium]